LNILLSQMRMIFKDFLLRDIRSQEIENKFYRNTRPTDNRFSTKYMQVCCYTIYHDVHPLFWVL